MGYLGNAESALPPGIGKAHFQRGHVPAHLGNVSIVPHDLPVIPRKLLSVIVTLIDLKTRSHFLECGRQILGNEPHRNYSVVYGRLVILRVLL